MSSQPFGRWSFQHRPDQESIETMFKAVDKMLRHVIKRTSPPFMLTLTGPSGVGKTHLATEFMHNVRAMGGSCGMLNWATWCASGFQDENIKHLRRYQFPLVIDEVFLIDATMDKRAASMESRALISILEERMGKWTLLTTNASLKDIQERDERLYSRLIRNGAFVIECDQKATDFSTCGRSQAQ